MSCRGLLLSHQDVNFPTKPNLILWEAGGTCLSGAVLVGDLTWEVAFSGLLGEMALSLYNVSSQLGRGQSSSLLSGFLCCNLSFHFPNSLSVLTAFFPLSLPFCSLLPPLLILSLAGPHFLFVFTLKANLFEVPELQSCPVTGCYSEAHPFLLRSSQAFRLQQ